MMRLPLELDANGGDQSAAPPELEAMPRQEWIAIKMAPAWEAPTRLLSMLKLELL